MSGVFTRNLPQNDLLRSTSIPPVTGFQSYGAGTGTDTFIKKTFRQIEVRDAETGDFTGVPNEMGNIDGLTLPSPDKHISTEILNERYKDIDLTFEKPTTEKTAGIIAKGRKADLIRADIMARGPMLPALAGSLLATAIDPIEVASAFVPIVSQARMAGLISRFGNVGGRVAAGAIEGAVGNAIFEPVYYGLSRQQHLDYGMSDALMNVGIGGLFGGTVGFGVGLVARRAKIKAGEAPFEVTKIERAEVPLPQVVKQMNIEKRVAAHRAAIAQVAQGKTVDVGGFTRARGEPDTVARHAPGGANRPQTLVEMIAQNGGVNDLDPTFRGEIDARGNPKVPFAGRLARDGSTRNLDDFAQLAHEEGFIDSPEVRALLDAIDTELRGEPVVRRSDINAQISITEGKAIKQDAERQLEAFDRAHDELRASGILDATPDEITRVAKMMERDGLSADDAFERVAIQDEGTVARNEMNPERDYSSNFTASRAFDDELSQDLDIDAELNDLSMMAQQMRDFNEIDDIDFGDIDLRSSAFADTARVAAACLAR